MKYYWFVFCKTELLIEKTKEGQYTIPYGEEPPVGLKEWTTVHTVDIPEPLRSDDGATEVRTFRIDAPYQGEGANGKAQERIMEMCGLRASYHLLPRQLYLIAGKCQEILYWDANTKFCGVCGAPMKLHTNISKRCTECGKEVWPQLATAVIVLIQRKASDGNPQHNEVLLVHANNFRSNYYGLVAGFVETGETLEEAVEREVAEEVGLKIKNLRYFGSQPWPYPAD